jgi:hypothetical protein
MRPNGAHGVLKGVAKGGKRTFAALQAEVGHEGKRTLDAHKLKPASLFFPSIRN